jgi:hypothetical protein
MIARAESMYSDKQCRHEVRKQKCRNPAIRKKASARGASREWSAESYIRQDITAAY